jgi:hypothetical protein
MTTRKDRPAKPAARRRYATTIAIAIGTVIAMTLVLGLPYIFAPSTASARRIGFPSLAEAAEVADHDPPLETAGTPGIADAHAVIEFNQLARIPAPAAKPQPRVLPRPMPNPNSDTMVAGTAMAPTSGSLPLPTAQSPVSSTNFLGLDDDGTVIPPDTQGTVGPNHLMTTLNSQVRVQNKAGGVLSTVSIDAFWSSMSVAEAFDPRIVYDPNGNRWIFSSGADPRLASAAILIGVSQTSDPTGTWNLYKIKADASSTLYADFPTLGFNANWIVVQANMYGNAGDAFSRSNIWALNKADLYAGGGGAYTLMKSAGGFTQFPALTYDSTISTEYLLEVRDGSSGQLRMSKITGAVGSEVLTTGIALPTGAAWRASAGVTNFAPQLGSATRIDTDDDRILSCVYRNGALWAAHRIYLPASGTATRSAAQWWEIDTLAGDLGKVLQRGRIDDPTDNFDFAYPSIAVNQRGDAMIGYSRFGASQYASANYAFHAAADAAGSNEGDTVLKAGEAPYFKDFGAGDNRWGDYSNTAAVDPANDIDFWTLQEYAASGSNWSTWWGQIALAASPTPTPTPSPSPTMTPTPSPTPTPAALMIGATSLANGKLRGAYSAPIMIAGGKAPYHSFITAGTLPPGMSLGASTGIIAGTPLGTGTYAFAVAATDSAGRSVSKNLSITIVN